VELKDSVLASLAVIMGIRDILIILQLSIRCGRTSAIRSPTITALHAPGTAREPTVDSIANTKFITIIKPNKILS